MRLALFDDRRGVLLLERVAVADICHRAVAVRVREVEVALRDELGRHGGLGLLVLAGVLEAAGIRTTTRYGSGGSIPRMVSLSVSRRSPAFTRPVRDSRSNSNSNGTNCGSFTFGQTAATISKNVSPCWPLRIWRSALRWLSSARSSMIGTTSPLPSCIAPGHLTVPAQCNPVRSTSPKLPLSIRIATAPSQWSCVGNWLKSHGHPGSQLQFLNQGPSMYQSVATRASSCRLGVR